MSTRHALILSGLLMASAVPVPSMTPVECGMKYRSCDCVFVDRHGWQCRGYRTRTASEEPPKFPDEERSKPAPPDPADIVPIQ